MDQLDTTVATPVTAAEEATAVEPAAVDVSTTETLLAAVRPHLGGASAQKTYPSVLRKYDVLVALREPFVFAAMVQEQGLALEQAESVFKALRAVGRAAVAQRLLPEAAVHQAVLSGSYKKAVLRTVYAAEAKAAGGGKRGGKRAAAADVEDDEGDAAADDDDEGRSSVAAATSAAAEADEQQGEGGGEDEEDDDVAEIAAEVASRAGSFAVSDAAAQPPHQLLDWLERVLRERDAALLERERLFMERERAVLELLRAALARCSRC